MAQQQIEELAAQVQEMMNVVAERNAAIENLQQQLAQRVLLLLIPTHSTLNNT